MQHFCFVDFISELRMPNFNLHVIICCELRLCNGGFVRIAKYAPHYKESEYGFTVYSAYMYQLLIEHYYILLFSQLGNHIQ